MTTLPLRLGVAAAAIAGAIALPLAASADTIPSYAQGDESIHGTVSGFDGKYALAVRDERGFVDNVQLHDGTVINPTGLRLASGMTVKIYGHTSGSSFAANEIDTPYHRSYAQPYPVYGPYAPYYGGYAGPYYRARIGLHF